ncbi:hypothetical protein [Halopiger djelfimassiliensis]|uniref:hypothetical protein n=1 Tax=Halopiger djelfimassiliensis TaxID=1293047 RepID=UPI0006779A8C|nr:hypothetical protein [Halopiger djelfimassiliensis]
MSRYGPRIAALERRAERERAAFDGGDATDAAGRAITPESSLRDGAGRAIGLYVEARAGGRQVPLSEPELAALRRAMNDWLECYARCHGVALEAEFPVRKAAALLLRTGNVDDVGQLLTGVPPRERR